LYRASTVIVGAAHSAQRPATKVAALIAVLFFACCIARSDAQPENAMHHSLDTSRIVGSWYGSAPSNASQYAIADARAAGVVASVQSLLTTPKTDASASMPERVAPLRVDTQIHSRRVFESAPPVVRFSPYLTTGQRRTIRAGVRGIAWVTERITLWNDVVVDRTTLSHETVRNATPAQVVVGTPKTLAQLRSALPNQTLATAMTMVATAYTASTATAYPTGYTATGVLAHEGIVAVDPHVIPLGTTMFIPGYGIAVAADTGGAIIGHRIDLCMDRYGDAVNFGRQTVSVYILKR
jgi:3D (Asp-Asp-Asp) domain-containing protein